MAEPHVASRRRFSALTKLLAWGVHLYTALGLLAAAGIAFLLSTDHPDAQAFHGAFLLMVAATLVDATDGMLARGIRVKEVLPGFDGRRLDDLIDFLNYTCLPLLLIWRAELLPGGQALWLLVPLLASAYGFCQVTVKTADGYFLGFPSYWNFVAFYLYVLRPAPWVALVVILTLSVLTFVPSRYLYPSQRGRLNKVTFLLGVLWVGFPVWILGSMASPSHAQTSAEQAKVRTVALLSLWFPAYYLLVSWFLSFRIGVRAQLLKKTSRPQIVKGADHAQMPSL